MKKIFFLQLFCSFAYIGQAQIHGAGGGTVNPGIFAVAGTPTVAPGTIITTTTNPVTSAQWHFGGRNNEALGSNLSEDWIYSLVATDKKEVIACGYQGIAHVVYSAGGTHRGAIIKLDHYGKLVWNKSITSATVLDYSSGTLSTTTGVTLQGGQLWQVTKGSNGYVAVGEDSRQIDPTHYQIGILVVEFDDDGNFLNGTPIFVIPPLTPTIGSTITIASGYRQDANAYSVAVEPIANSLSEIIIGGRTGTMISHKYDGINEACLLKMQYSSGSWSLPYSLYTGDGGSSINKILAQGSGSSYNIYGCGAISATTGSITDNRIEYIGSTGFKLHNKDVWIFKIDNTFSSSSFKEDKYNKDNIKVNIAGSSTPVAINSSYTSPVYKYSEFGPLSARNYDAYGAITWHNSYYIDGDPFHYTGSDITGATELISAPVNYVETAEDMIFANDASGKILLAAGVNYIGSMIDNIYNTDEASIVISGAPSVCPQYGEYVDFDGFLLQINPADIGTTTSTTLAKNVGHFSGANFNMQLRQDYEYHIIISGSTADHYGVSDMNLPDADWEHADQNAFLIATNRDFSPYSSTANSTADNLWRRSYEAADPHAAGDDANEDCICVYGLDITADGGYVIGGNNDEEGDDWSITKFAPLHQELLIKETGSAGYERFGAYEIPAERVIYGTENWTTSKKIASKITVSSGATLNITGSSTVISFAASDQLWDYTSASDGGSGTIGCGIVVEPGGHLHVEDATLQGISFTGQHNVWDGIVVHGTYGAACSTAYQGSVALEGATIKDARYGIYVAENYRSYYRAAPVTTTGSVTQSGYTYSSRYDGSYILGGGIVTAGDHASTHTTFLNCWYGANFENWFYPGHNTSSFSNCVFNCDATGMGDICYYTDGDGNLLPSNTHIGAWQWHGLTLRKNTFTCDLSFPRERRPNGFVSTAGSAIVSNSGSGLDPGNTFSNLNYGIAASNGCGTMGLVVANNIFDNNNYGASISGHGAGLVVKYNNFLVPGNGVTFNPTGLTLAGCSDFDVSENTFNKCSGCTSTGDWVNNYGIVNNHGTTISTSVPTDKLSLNVFENVWFASTAVGENYGLSYKCNDYNNNVYGIMRTSHLVGFSSTIPCTIDPHQGFCGTSANTAAGNRFYTCPSTVLPPRILADADVLQDVTYHNNASTTAYDPGTPSTCIETHNTLASGTPPEILVNTSCSFTSFDREDACPTPPHEDWSPVSGGTLDVLAVLDATIASNTDEDLAVELAKEHRLLLGHIVRSYKLNGDYDDAAALYAGYDMYKEAMECYMLVADYTNAQAMHDNLPTTTAEDIQYAWLTQKWIDLYSIGNTWFDLDNTSRTTLGGIVQYNSASGYMAGAIKELIGIDVVTWPVPEMPSGLYGSKQSPGAPPISKPNEGGAQSCTVFPNPTFGTFTVKASLSGKFELYTLLGQKLQEYAINTGETALQLPSGLATGLYIGRYRSADGSKPTEIKFVYQP